MDHFAKLINYVLSRLFENYSLNRIIKLITLIGYITLYGSWINIELINIVRV